MYRIQFSKKAQRQFQALPQLVQEQLQPKIDALSINPRPFGIKALQGRKGLLRLRAGDYRVIYQLEDDLLIVLIVEVGHRREVYRN
ncbi:type II toxin-antitoxin system RelE/ParE family toxin [Planktothrix agardhii 1032]|uniref:type II toxin-antitoxin system RelE family toxin n=1 Tax=Planktothrix agardhii TaxID=1160 RepID=UPI001D0BD331|nr:type II toxin-antitoxin system RelE/ParE family toxin [Planktothrix agardhii]MCB8777511.1 type II toxin-antitoxin system RelE/ParE family toxin [Planktothrix agardhii 1031]MCF3598974.1 type II toxin-antitoxin system RelE/ParE family toxin [Planktothrix agardhii 1032]